MKKNKTKKKMTIAAALGGIGVAGYMYMKKHPQVMDKAKNMMKEMERKKLNLLDD